MGLFSEKKSTFIDKQLQNSESFVRETIIDGVKGAQKLAAQFVKMFGDKKPDVQKAHEVLNLAVDQLEAVYSSLSHEDTATLKDENTPNSTRFGQ